MPADAFHVPNFGPVRPVLLARWLVPDGGAVDMNEPVCEIETEMATVDLPSPGAGTLRQLAREGDHLRPGDPVGIITPVGD